jgi:hypothetical protein
MATNFSLTFKLRLPQNKKVRQKVWDLYVETALEDSEF